MEGLIYSSLLFLIDKKGNPNKKKMQQQKHNNNNNNNLLAKAVDQVLQKHTLLFNVEDVVLRSPSLFPYFMLVAFEGGGLLRALVLLLSYPLARALGEGMRLKLMVFICFFGLREGKFRVGRSVLPKFLLEDVGYEGLELVRKFGKKVAVTNLPRVMVESFLVDYLGVEEVIGREIKVVGGYYLGLMMEDGKFEERGFLKESIISGVKSQVIGIASTRKSFKAYPLNQCKDMYLVSKEEKKKWHKLPRDKYPKPLVFHDGRLAFTPTPLNTLVMFLWLPFGVLLCIARVVVGLLLPYSASAPLLAFLGVAHSSPAPLSLSPPHGGDTKGLVYVSNHRTVLDPLYIQRFCRTPLTAMVYSVSGLSKLIAPVKTITLRRDREKDARLMLDELSRGRVVVICPEGTTCREPYLLRFSPLFAEISDNIVPVALECHVSMFYGTTASGMKALDPFFHMLNPWSSYRVEFLGRLPREETCGGGGASKFEVANRVQARIGGALGFECTRLTRKDKYLMLAGNTGVVPQA